jgi:hypothetical protein
VFRFPNSSIRRFVLIAAIADLTATTFALHAAEDVQQTSLGPHTFYVPKAWVHGGAVIGIAPSRTVLDAQSAPIEATTLAFRPQNDWKPYGLREMPEMVILQYVPRTGPPPLDKQRKDWLDQAAALDPDGDGFVRVATGFTKPGEPPQWEAFLYKGYLNKFGEPLVVVSDNMDYPLGNRAPSTVNITWHDDVGMEYRFDNRKFPRNTWWALYQRVLAFLDYLQMPK